MTFENYPKIHHSTKQGDLKSGSCAKSRREGCGDKNRSETRLLNYLYARVCFLSPLTSYVRPVTIAAWSRSYELVSSVKLD